MSTEQRPHQPSGGFFNTDREGGTQPIVISGLGSIREPVAEPPDSEKVLRVPRILFEFLPQQTEVNIYRTGHGHGTVSPDVLKQLLTGNGFIPMLNEVPQKFEFAG